MAIALSEDQFKTKLLGKYQSTTMYITANYLIIVYTIKSKRLFGDYSVT